MDASLERWRGKVALVTGASGDIGAAIATALGGMGMRVALVGRNRARLQRVRAAVRARGGQALVLAGDQARATFNRTIFRRVRKAWGPVDVLVNNAATRGGNSLVAADWSEVQAALDVNVRAALLCMREAVADMRSQPESAIINIGSMVGHRVLPGVPAMYAATKHALRVLTDGLRAEVIQRHWPIKVALVSPGLTDTGWHRRPGGIRRGGRPYPHDPLQPGDVAAAVVQILATPRHVQVRDIQLSSSAQPF